MSVCMHACMHACMYVYATDDFWNLPPLRPLKYHYVGILELACSSAPLEGRQARASPAPALETLKISVNRLEALHPERKRFEIP